MRTTKAGRRVLVGLTNARRLAGRGVRATKGVVRKGIARIRNTKLVVAMRNKVGKGAKSLGELRERILEHFKFRRTWFERHGKWIELWGEFNAKVILIREDGSVEFNEIADGLTLNQRKKLLKGDIVGGRVRNKRSIKVIVSDSFEASFREMTEAERREIVEIFRNSRFGKRRAVAYTGSDPIPSWAKGTEWEIYFKQRGKINTSYSGSMNADEQIHHLVSMENLSHPVTKKGVKGGFNINDASTNGKKVKTYSGVERTNATDEITASPSGIHASHPNYTNAQTEMLDNFRNDFPGATNDEAAKFLRIMSQKLNHAIDGIPSTRKIDELFKYGTYSATGMHDVNTFYNGIIQAYLL